MKVLASFQNIKDWFWNKKANHQQTLRVVSDEQETSVLSPTRTASLTCKNKIAFIYKLCI